MTNQSFNILTVITYNSALVHSSLNWNTSNYLSTSQVISIADILDGIRALHVETSTSDVNDTLDVHVMTAEYDEKHVQFSIIICDILLHLTNEFTNVSNTN